MKTIISDCLFSSKLNNELSNFYSENLVEFYTMTWIEVRSNVSLVLCIALIIIVLPQMIALISVVLLLMNPVQWIKYWYEIIMAYKEGTEREVIDADNPSLSRHHIIPKRVLINFWDNVIENKHFDQVLLPLIESYSYKNPKSLIRMNISYPNHHYLWLPCNLFYGPTKRFDDPGSNFEMNCHHITHITKSKARNFRKVFDLILLYRKYRDPNIAKDAVDLLLKYKTNPITPWNEKDWIGPNENIEYAINNNKQRLK